jgi:hypothetical protein
VPILDGDLGLVKGGRANSAQYTPEERTQWHAMLAYIATERGYKPGWAAVNFKEKFKTWPPYGAVVQPIPPTPEVRSWVRSRLIAYAKSRSAA